MYWFLVDFLGGRVWDVVHGMRSGINIVKILTSYWYNMRDIMIYRTRIFDIYKGITKM